MIRRLLIEERGYSLVEVMASIMILSLAILPMAGVFDMGLETATTGSNYDKARTLANLKLEEAKGLQFGTVENVFPEPAGPTTYDDGPGYYQSAWQEESGVAGADFANFEYRIEKQYMKQPSAEPDPDGEENFLPCTPLNVCVPPTNLIRITVTVQLPNGSTYTTFGLVTE